MPNPASSRPSGTDQVRPGYAAEKLEGASILGTGGDCSQGGSGTFFEGAMTIGMPSDATDDVVQANIVAAGYAR
jgi:non-reducing end alpha-L-arabinofuranosidase